MSVCSGPIVAPALHLHVVPPLPTTQEAPAHPHRVDIVRLPADPVLPRLTLVPLVHHPSAAVSVPRPVLLRHHLYPAAGLVPPPTLLHLVTAVTGVEEIAAAPRLEDAVSLRDQVDPFHTVEVALDRLHRAMWCGAGV